MSSAQNSSGEGARDPASLTHSGRSGGGREVVESGSPVLPWLVALAILPMAVVATLVYVVEARTEASHVRQRLEELADVREAWLETHLASLNLAAHLVAGGLSDRLPTDALDPGPTAAQRVLLQTALDRSVTADSLILGGALLDAAGNRIVMAGRSVASRPPAPELARATADTPLISLVALDAAPEFAELRVAPLEQPGDDPIYLELLFSGRDLLRVSNGSAGFGPGVETLLGIRRDDGTVVAVVDPEHSGDGRPLQPLPESEAIQALELALDGQESFLGEGRDHRGVRVVASTRHLEGPGWGLVVKQDRSEAYASVQTLGRTLLAGGGLISLLVLGIATAVGSRADHLSDRLRTSRERFRALFQNAPIGMARVAVDGHFQEVNPALVELLGYPPDELLARTVEDLTHPEDWPKEQRPVRDLLKGRSNRFQLRKRYVRADGSILPSRTTISVVRSPNGRVRYYVAEVEDVSAEEAAEQRTQRALNRLEATLDATPIPLFELDPGGHVVRWNSAAEEAFGWTEEEAVGQLLPNVPDEGRETFHELREQLLAGGRLEGVELLRFRRKDGSLLPVRAYGAPVVGREGEVVGIVGLTEDIRDEKAREEELRSLNRALRFVSESNMAVVRSKSREALLERVGRTALETGGYSHAWIAYRREGRQGLHLFQSAPADGSRLDILALPGFLDEVRGPRAVSVAFVVQSLTEAGGGWQAQLLERGYGSLAMLPFSGVDPDADGTVEGEAESGFLVLAHRDPQAFDHAELAVLEELTSDLAYGLGISVLRNQLSLIRAAVESLDLGVVILDARTEDLPVTFANAGLAGMMGCDREELQDRPGTWALGAETDPELRRDLEEALAANRPCQMVLQAHRDSGEAFWDRITVSPVQEDGEEVAHLVCIHEDVSEHKRMGEELDHRSRLVAVGELAGGVAHDFRNILTAAQGLAQLSLQTAELPTEIQENLHDLTRVVARGTAVTERLLALSRRGTTKPRPVALASLLDEIVSVVGHTLRDDIELHHDGLEDVKLHVHLDPDQFTQALFNLARNAEQAMPRGGRLSVVATHPVPPAILEGAPPRVRHGAGKEWIYLGLSDTGVGMDAETLKRAFDPYFTTKPSGEGTGLGLAAVVGVVERMEGRIWMTSTPGVGTVAHLLLPPTEAVDASEGETSAEEDAAPAPGKPTGTILLAEDDPSVLRVFTRGLERLGFTVIPTEDGAEALAEFEKDPAAVDVVVTDGVMPRISGAGLADRVWHLRPETPVIVTSGFGSAELRHEFPEDPPAPLIFLPKPLEIDELRDALAPLLPNGHDASEPPASSGMP